MSMFNVVPSQSRSTRTMDSQMERLLSFCKWPKHVAAEFPPASLFAKKGFYHTGGTKVKCFICHLVLNVERGNRAFGSLLERHHNLSPTCAMKTGAQTLNKPMIVTEAAKLAFREWRQRRRIPREMYPSLSYNVHPESSRMHVGEYI